MVVREDFEVTQVMEFMGRDLLGNYFQIKIGANNYIYGCNIIGSQLWGKSPFIILWFVGGFVSCFTLKLTLVKF